MITQRVPMGRPGSAGLGGCCGVSTSKLFEISGIKPLVSRDCLCLFTERTYSKIPILFSADLVPSQIEQVADRSMRAQKSLSLLD